jgi:aspartyl-tRNA(Asn)/glutamyl-tRNA(Gln) amidotransferase subunit C
MKIDRDQVLHVARLARLDLEDDAVERFANQLADILNYVEVLNQADTEGVEPTSHVLDLTNALRPDEPENSLDRDRALANAPDRSEDCFLVPKVVG